MARAFFWRVYFCLTLAFCFVGSLSGQITFSGDNSPNYDGSDPWVVGSTLMIGIDNSGLMWVDNFSVVESDGGIVGVNAGGEGNVEIIGANAQWNLPGDNLIVGQNGNGSILVGLGGSLQTENLVVGDQTGIGEITVTGFGSSLVSTGSFAEILIANHSNGALTVSDGGSIESDRMVFGNSSGTVADVVFEGAGTSVTANELSFSTGLGGGHTNFLVQDGANVSVSGDVYLTGEVASQTITISGNNSRFNVNGEFNVGYWTDAEVSILNGAQINANSLLFAGKEDFDDYSFGGSLLVAGENSLLNTNSMVVGFSSNFTLADGGRIYVANGMEIAQGGTFLLNGGTLDLNGNGLRGLSQEDGFQFTDGTLFDPGQIDGRLIQNGGTLSPGDMSGITVLQSGFELNQGELSIELFGLLDHDQVQVVSDVDLIGADGLENALLTLTLGYVPTMNDSFIILQNDGSDPISGMFANGTMVSAFFNDIQYDFHINYQGGSGNDIVLTYRSVPEPGLLPILPVLAVMTWRRKRK